MQTLIFTGPTGATATAAAATAAAAAAGGTRTLLASIGPSHPVATIVGRTPTGSPDKLAPNLDLWTLDAPGTLRDLWTELRGQRGGPAGDELPIIPGSDLFLAVTLLRRLAPGYELACVDAGSPAALLRALAVPDTMRWGVRLLLGLDREPGRSSASLSRALIPTSLLPFPMEWVGQLQDSRVRLEQLRDATLDPRAAQVRYVLQPDAAGLAEALVALPALQLYGLAVERMIVGPLLPEGAARLALSELAAEQARVLADAATLWAPRPALPLALGATPGTPAALAAVGAQLYAGTSPLPAPPPAAPVQSSGPPDPHVSLSLPGLPRDELSLTMSGDELIVRAGPYRRHLLLPEGLRGVSSIRAARQGEQLVIRPR